MGAGEFYDQERITYDDAGRTVRTDDQNGRVVHFVYQGDTTTRTVESGGRRYRTLERYDPGGRLVEREEFHGDERVGHRVWTRDARGNVTRLSVDEDGSGPKYYHDYVYDAWGREIREDYGFFVEGGPFRRWTTTHADDHLSAVRVRTRLSDGKEHSRTMRVFDARGLLVSERQVEADGRLWSDTQWTYDAAGRRLTERSQLQENPPSLRTWHFDEGGNLQEITEDWGIDGTFDRRTSHTFGCWGAGETDAP